MIERRTFLKLASLASLSAIGSPLARASAIYPSRPVRLLVPYSAGGSTDIYTRIVAQGLTNLWKQPVIVENRTGASGALAVQQMLSAPADGYTMCVSSVALSIHSLIFPTPPYKDSDVVPVVNLVVTPNVLIVPKNSKYMNAKDVIEDARKNPGRLNYGMAGTGTTQHIIGEMLKIQQKLDVQAIPYKGNAPAVAATMAGDVDYAFAAVPEITSMVKSGKIKALAIMAAERSQFLPGVPTMAEAGYNDLESSLWFGLVAPAATPAPILQLANRDFNFVLADPVIRKRIEDTGGTVLGGTAKAFSDQIASDRARTWAVIKAASIKME